MRDRFDIALGGDSCSRAAESAFIYTSSVSFYRLKLLEGFRHRLRVTRRPCRGAVAGFSRDFGRVLGDVEAGFLED